MSYLMESLPLGGRIPFYSRPYCLRASGVCCRGYFGDRTGSGYRVEKSLAEASLVKLVLRGARLCRTRARVVDIVAAAVLKRGKELSETN